MSDEALVPLVQQQPLEQTHVHIRPQQHQQTPVLLSQAVMKDRTANTQAADRSLNSPGNFSLSGMMLDMAACSVHLCDCVSPPTCCTAYIAVRA